MARKKQPNPKRVPTVTKKLSLNPTLKEQFKADQAKKRKELALARNVDVSHIEREENIKKFNKRRAIHAIQEENKPELANNTKTWPSYMRMQYDQYQTFAQTPRVDIVHGFTLAHQPPARRRGRARLVIHRPRNDGRRAPPNSP